MLYPIRIPAKSTMSMGPNELKSLSEQTKDLKLLRGHLLDIIINIELDIDKFIERSFLPKNSKTKEIFKRRILNSKNISLKLKIDMLKELLELKKDIKLEEIKLLTKNLEFCINERNKWAHGEMFFIQEKQNKKIIFQPYLKYINNKGEEKHEKLTDNYFDSLNEKLFHVHENFELIMIKKGILKKQESKFNN